MEALDGRLNPIMQNEIWENQLMVYNILELKTFLCIHTFFSEK